MTPEERKKVNPRVVFFAGKAAPGYYIAKLTIRLIVNVARVINADPDTKEYLEMFFLPDYSVSLAEILIPASDLSQHSGSPSSTSNMSVLGTNTRITIQLVPQERRHRVRVT